MDQAFGRVLHSWRCFLMSDSFTAKVSSVPKATRELARLWTVCDPRTEDYKSFNITLGDHQLLEPLNDLCFLDDDRANSWDWSLKS